MKKFLVHHNLTPVALVLALTVFFTHQHSQDAARVAELQSRAQLAQTQVLQAQIEIAQARAAVPHLVRQSIAEAFVANEAITDRDFVSVPGRCSQWVHEVVNVSQHHKFNRYFGPSARDTGNNFLNSPYGYLWPDEQKKLGGVLQPGDILIKRSAGPFGHIGIYVGRDGHGRHLVAENSSTHVGRIQGAKGYRTLEQFGFSWTNNSSVDVVVRLPLPKK